MLFMFDCDGVLVDSEPLAARAYERVYEKHGMKGVGPDIIAQCIGMKQADILVRIRELTGHRFPEHANGDIWAETKALFTEHLAPTAGIRQFLEGLAVERCVASSSSLERIHHSLDVTGLAPFFGEAIFSSSMVGLPVSTTHVVSGAIMGVGATRRLSAVRWGVAGNLVIAWVCTIPLTAMWGALLYHAIRYVFKF